MARPKKVEVKEQVSVGRMDAEQPPATEPTIPIAIERCPVAQFLEIKGSLVNVNDIRNIRKEDIGNEYCLNIRFNGQFVSTDVYVMKFSEKEKRNEKYEELKGILCVLEIG